MKKFLPIILSTLFLASCAHGQIDNSKSSNSSNLKVDTVVTKLTISDIFPFKKDMQLKYTSGTGDNSSSTLSVDYIKNNRLQFRLVNADTSVGYVVENSNGELKMITSRDEFYYHDDLTSIQNAKPDIMLKEPLVKGTSWKLVNGDKRYISNDSVQIATASGKYIALEVTTETENGKVIDYYAPNIGLVKKITSTSNKNIISSLESTTDSGTSTETVKFYYPNAQETNIQFFKRQLHFKTDDDAKTYFETFFKETPSSDLVSILPPNVKINKLYFNYIEKKVYVDFSKEFETEMNLGSTGEDLVLKCITDTLCDYYNVDKLNLTVEGMPYQSGHIIMKPNEAMYIDIKNIVEFK